MDGKVFNHVEINRRIADLTYGVGGWFYDLEGCPCPNSEKEAMLRAFELAKPKLNDSYKGVAIVMGTGDDLSSGNIQDFFFTPTNYNIIPFKNTWDVIT